jgi:hypothetical protein
VAKVGRPALYTPELGLKVCERIANGESLRAIARDPETPALSTMWAWLESHPEFSARYARAREQQADKFAEEIVAIADEEEDPQKARVRIDARKWVASKLKPKSYGDRVEQHMTGELTINVLPRAVRQSSE